MLQKQIKKERYSDIIGFTTKKPERSLSHDNYNRRNAFSQEIM